MASKPLFTQSFHPRRVTGLSEFLGPNTIKYSHSGTNGDNLTRTEDKFSKTTNFDSHSASATNWRSTHGTATTTPNFLEKYPLGTTSNVKERYEKESKPKSNERWAYSATEVPVQSVSTAGAESHVNTSTLSHTATSSVNQLLNLVKEFKKIDVDNIELSLKDISSSDLKLELEKKSQDYDALKEAHDETIKKYQDAVNKNDELVSKAKELIREAKEKAHREQEEKLRQMKTLLREKEDEITILRSEKDSALSRLSKEMGEKLSENNPGIADLSDPNRSTKLAEKYNSLYDNEWTDALESLSHSKVEEEEAVRFLLEIIKHIYSFCTGAKTELMQELESLLSSPVSAARRHIERNSEKGPEDKQIRQMLDSCVKIKANTAISSLQTSYSQLSVSQKPRFADQLPEYVNKCIEICWLMNTHSPALVFGEPVAIGQKFNKDNYKEFTKQGDTVSFVVWLPLLIEKNGAVLSKGVVQPLPKPIKSDPKTVKTRSRRETDEEHFKRLLLDDNNKQYERNLIDDKRSPERLHNVDRYDKDRAGDRYTEWNDQQRSRETSKDSRVDEIFKASHPSPYSSDISNPVSTYNTNNNSEPKGYYSNWNVGTSRMSEHPSATNASRHTDEYNYRRPHTALGTQTVANQNIISHIDFSKAEIFRAGKDTYALYDKQLYAKDRHSNSWRLTSGFNGESHA